MVVISYVSMVMTLIGHREAYHSCAIGNYFCPVWGYNKDPDMWIKPEQKYSSTSTRSAGKLYDFEINVYCLTQMLK